MATVDRTICERCRAEVTTKALFCPMCGAPRATQASDPLIGTVVAERYLLRERIGQGGSGTIYRADHVALHRKVAVKILHHELARDDAAVERFRREATTVSEIDNEHIALVLDFGRAPDGRPFVAMELLEGETLQTTLHREKQLPVADVLDILTQVGEALMEAHGMGYVHRDLRPGNIFLARRKGKRFVKILDFGLAKLIEHEGVSAASTMGMTFGDPCYMSPEQARGETVDRRADIYALGVMAFEILTGQPPFIGDRVFDVLTQHIESTPATPSALRPDVPEWLDAIVLRALAKQPDERFVTVQRFIEALDEGRASGTVMTDANALSMPSIEPPPPAPRPKDSDTGIITRAIVLDPTPVPTPAPAKPVPSPSPSRRVTMPPMEPGSSQGWYDAGEKISHSASLPILPDPFVDQVPVEKRSRSPLFVAIGIVLVGAGVGGYLLFGNRDSAEPPTPEAAPPPVAIATPTPPPAAVPEPVPVAVPPVPAAAPPDAAPPDASPSAAAMPVAVAAEAPPTAPPPARRMRAPKVVAPARPPPGVAAASKPASTAPDAGPSEVAAVPLPPAAVPADDPTTTAAEPAAVPVRPPPDDRNPVQAEFYVKLGQRALRDGDADGAVESFNKARGFDNLNADAIAGLGAVALVQGRPGDATVHLEAAARLAPGSARIQTLRGQAYLAAGKRVEAAAAFKKALKLNPDDQAAATGYKEAAGE